MKDWDDPRGYYWAELRQFKKETIKEIRKVSGFPHIIALGPEGQKRLGSKNGDIIHIQASVLADGGKIHETKVDALVVAGEDGLVAMNGPLRKKLYMNSKILLSKHLAFKLFFHGVLLGKPTMSIEVK